MKLVSAERLSDMVREFVCNPSQRKELSESKEQSFLLPDGRTWSYPVSEGIVTLQSHVDTSFEAYLSMQNTLNSAYAAIRDEAAMAAFDQSFAALDDAERAIILQAVPYKISEAEPHP